VSWVRGLGCASLQVGLAEGKRVAKGVRDREAEEITIRRMRRYSAPNHRGRLNASNTGNGPAAYPASRACRTCSLVHASEWCHSTVSTV
jgi:hypothetical protein